MQQDFSAMLTGMAEANQKAVDAASEFHRITARTQTRLAKRQLAAFEDCVEAGNRMFKAATESRDPQEAAKAHTQVAVELGEKLVAATQEAFEIQVEARDELVRLMENGMKTMKAEAESAIKVAAPAKKPARSGGSSKKPA